MSTEHFKTVPTDSLNSRQHRKQLAIAVGQVQVAVAKIAPSVADQLTAAGTNQATALTLGLELTQVIRTAAAGTGVIIAVNLPHEQALVNYGANAITVYPPVGGKIANGATNAGVTLAAGKTMRVRVITNLDLAVLLSA